MITKEDENYASFSGYSKLTIGTEESVTNENGAGFGNGLMGNSATAAEPTNNYAANWGGYYLNNLGKNGAVPDEDGFIILNISMEKVEKVDDDYNTSTIAASEYDGFGFQSTSDAKGVPKIEIYDVTFTE